MDTLGIERRGWNVQAQHASHPFVSTPLEVSFETTCEAAYNLIDRINNYTNLIRVESVVMRNASPQDDNLAINLRLHVISRAQSTHAEYREVN